MRFLIAESETKDEREERRAHTGRSLGETYCETLRTIVPDPECRIVAPADADAEPLSPGDIARFDAVFVTGSPLHVYQDTPETRRQLAFMRAVFASGTPSFGSCAGLQLAAAAAGGTVRPLARKEAGLSRRITRTPDGRDHPLLAGRGPAWDASGIHGDEVETLPPDACVLATNATSRVQAAEIRHDGGVFWGVQYHPEVPLAEIAVALRRQADDLVASGLALTTEAVSEQAALFEALDRNPDRLDLRWRLGVDAEIAEPARRMTEVANFIRHLVLPTRALRARAEAA